MRALVSLLLGWGAAVLAATLPATAQLAPSAPGTPAAWLAGGAAAATPVQLPGQQEAAFAAAVERWLADDEAAALPELAALAQAGNASAQLLLALIDKTPALQGPWLARLPRAERVALMRMPGGLSGKSWMEAAAVTLPLAGLWKELWEVTAPVALVLDFAAAGESRAAREAALTLAAREVRGLAEVATAPGYPSALRYLAWRERDADGAARTAAERASLTPGDPQRGMGSPGTEAPDPAALAEWLLSAPEAAPIGRLCTDRCPETAAACALAAWEALASHRGLMVLGSPSERLIPSGEFHASRRGQAAVLRRVLLASDARGRRLQVARAQERDACFGAVLEDEAQRYMSKRD